MCLSFWLIHKYVKNMHEEIKAILHTNKDLVDYCDAQIVENYVLHKEKVYLRAMKAKPSVSLSKFKQILTDSTNRQFINVTIVAGRADCSSNISISELSKDVEQVVLQAKALAPNGTMHYSSTLQCVNNPACQKRVEELNSCSKATCKKANINFIDNDPSYRLGDDEINEGIFEPTGSSPSLAGKRKLRPYLQITSLVSTPDHTPDKPTYSDAVK